MGVDVDGDGKDDLLIGNGDWRIGYDSVLFYGPLTPPTDSNGDPRIAIYSDVDATFENLRYGVSSAGDQNQDGYEDIWVGGGTIHLFYGAPN